MSKQDKKNSAEPGEGGSLLRRLTVAPENTLEHVARGVIIAGAAITLFKLGSSLAVVAVGDPVRAVNRRIASIITAAT